jgi:hypothetical protein
MPSVSGAQHRYMAMASTPAGRAKLASEGHKPPSGAVAKDFLKADKGKHFRLKHVVKK